ncbi:hypothetical protein HPB50_001266 [Hyalomma asiaticum]|uniref:Uncharacterized protein n=1 Tax=Hyalomma asiaticum TaxID=266040 RepID=A0ACB7SJM0_HYAAI|nr:hypothetical protein HPB50_001266 [Hyalomma asiaticum]
MSVGHCRRVCKILRSECWRQSRFLKDCLRAGCSTCGDASIDRRSYRVWYESAKQKNAGEPGKLLVLGDTQVDEEQKNILKLGPKFCVEPSLQLPDRLALARAHFKELLRRSENLSQRRGAAGKQAPPTRRRSYGHVSRGRGTKK